MSNPTNALTHPAVTVVQAKKDIRDFIQSDAMKSQIALVLPKHLTADRMTRVALTALLKTPKLLECSRESLLQALMTCSQFGLEPDGRNAHLIPYGNVVQLILDYKGLVELAMRSGVVANIHADVVCDNDAFEYDRGELKTHRIEFRKPRGEVYAAYALVRFKDGTEKCEVMTKEAIEAIRSRSRAGKSGPWVTDWNEMAKKTVFRRLSKWITLSPEFRDAVDKDDDRLPEIEPQMTTVKPLFESAPITNGMTGGSNMSTPTVTVAELEALCEQHGVTPAQVVEFLHGTGFVEETLASLSDVEKIAPEKLTVIKAEMAGFAQQIKAQA